MPFSSKASDLPRTSRRSPLWWSTHTIAVTSPLPIGIAPLPSLAHTGVVHTTLAARASCSARAGSALRGSEASARPPSAQDTAQRRSAQQWWDILAAMSVSVGYNNQSHTPYRSQI